MNASNLQKKLTFKNKVISRVERFNRKHKAFSFLGIIYALLAITCYNFIFYFYRNSKRFTCFASILLFFVFSSSFSHPAMSLNISFASNSEIEGDVKSEEADMLSETVVAESDAELAINNDVDESLIQEANDSVNPDAAEAEHMVSSNEILAVNENEEEQFDEEESTKKEPKSEFSADDWEIMLVNKHHPIPDDYTFPLGTISGSMRCDERVIPSLLEMLKAANADGVSLIVCSPYRDIDRQTMLFGNKVDKYMNAGMSYMDAYNLAAQAVTVPGSSEHQVGLAVDIITDGYSSLDEGFSDTAAGKWLAANSSKYGFILRYPKGKEEITSIEFEPWHFRYVGIDAAEIIASENICLEEFWDLYVQN